jgi:hypothetical protein
MEKKKVSHILFNEIEQYVTIISGTTEEEATRRSCYYQDIYDNFKIVKTIKHSNSRHLWVADFLNKHKYNIPKVITGHSKKEIKITAATIRNLLKEKPNYQIYKLY